MPGEPEAGRWELDDRRWAHSRLSVVAGLRAVAAAVGEDLGGEGYVHRFRQDARPPDEARGRVRVARFLMVTVLV